MIRIRFVDDEEDIEHNHKKSSKENSSKKKNLLLILTLFFLVSSVSILTVSNIVSNRENSDTNEIVNKEETEYVNNSIIESKNINFPEVEFEYVEFNK